MKCIICDKCLYIFGQSTNTAELKRKFKVLYELLRNEKSKYEIIVEWYNSNGFNGDEPVQLACGHWCCKECS